jgi:pSer/pThr/pTyr-binding forkhead associated (FHA) protein
MATLSIYVPDQEPYAVDLDGIEQLSVGRGSDNDIVIDHVSLSGSHAVIRNAGGVYQVTDLGSTNGTFVNGEQVTESPLSEGLQIAFGNVQVVFSDGEAAPEAPEEPATGSAGVADVAHDQPPVVAEVSNSPANFKNLSPIEKIEKKDTLGQIAIIVGVVAILAAVALIALSATMKAV